MEGLWLIIIVIGIISKVSENKKKQAQRQKELQQRRESLSGGQGMPQRPPAQRPQEVQRKRPVQMNAPKQMAQESVDSLPEGLQSLIRMFTGEEEAKKDQQRMELELERRRREETQEREALEAVRMQEERAASESKWEDEWIDPNEISDLPDFITDEQMAIEGQMHTTSAAWNLTEAKKGIIWNEILERPRFRTEARHTREG